MSFDDERSIQADAEAAREQLLRAYEEKRYTLAEMREVFFDNDIAMGTLQAKLNGHAPIAGSNRRTIRMFASALTKIQAANCKECGLYKDIARRAVGLDDNEEPPSVPDHFFGDYNIYTRYVFYNSKSRAEDSTNSINRYRLIIYRCERCGFPRFRAEVKNDQDETLNRLGFAFMRSQRLHLMIISQDQFTHMLFRAHNLLEEGPLPGIVLYDRESNEAHTMFACRTALVKDGTGFADAIAADEWNQIDYFLRDDSVPRRDGVLGAYHYAMDK
ncbi:MAG: hypothetical protein AAGD13_05930 [Pseudomonadota bacterium]